MISAEKENFLFIKEIEKSNKKKLMEREKSARQMPKTSRLSKMKQKN